MGGEGEDALKNVFLTLSQLGLKIKGGGTGATLPPLTPSLVLYHD